MRCSDIEFVKRHARRSRDLRQVLHTSLVLPKFAGKTNFISLKSNYFSQISQSTRLKLKIFLLLLWTPVLKYRFSLYIVNLKEVGHNEIV